MKRHQLVFILFVMHCSFGGLFAQGKTYEGPDDPAGDIAAERAGYLTGDRVFLYFRNTTELSDWPRPDVSRWPNNANGTKMLNGVGFMIGARVYVEHDSIPVTDPAVISSRTDLDTLYFLQTSYREEMDRDPTGTVEWGFYPVFGYFNALHDKPAMSNDPRSWPPNGWPSRDDALIWPGEWNGRFGRGVQYADLETYFVVNDAHDQEYLGVQDRIKYYPRPGVRIGDIHPEYCTIQRGKPWGGLGIRAEVRGFQWNHEAVRDIIFWEYKIANISDYDLPEIAVGFWIDSGIGGDSADDELGHFDTLIDMVYSWDVNGIGNGGLPTGTFGLALLETPGLSFDQRDNDDDGLVDEKRDNVATRVIGPQEGIADLAKFLAHYNLTLENLRDHWDADEDQDWDDGNDANANGKYDLDEDAGDDVGLDGIGPGDLNYGGPDAGECNHRPDFSEGLGGEPDFAATDVSESDMIGLTAVGMFPMPSHASEYHWFRGDKSMWELIGEDSLVSYSGNISNLILTCGSGPFALHKGREERVSVAMVHAYDALEGLNSNSHAAPNLFQLKHAAQKIYENDYRFDGFPSGIVAFPRGASVPARCELLQNHPNPFNPATQIRYQLPQTANVVIAIYDVLGQEVRSLVTVASQAAGYYGVEWDGRDDTGSVLPSGIYFCKMVVKSSEGEELLQQIRKMVLVR